MYKIIKREQYKRNFNYTYVYLKHFLKISILIYIILMKTFMCPLVIIRKPNKDSFVQVSSRSVKENEGSVKNGDDGLCETFRVYPQRPRLRWHLRITGV